MTILHLLEDFSKMKDKGLLFDSYARSTYFKKYVDLAYGKDPTINSRQLPRKYRDNEFEPFSCLERKLSDVEFFFYEETKLSKERLELNIIYLLESLHATEVNFLKQVLNKKINGLTYKEWEKLNANI